MPFTIPDAVLQFLHVGGPVVWIHLLMSVLLLTILLLKLSEFAAAGLFSPFAARRARQLLRHWESDAREAALTGAEHARDPRTRLLRNAAGHLHHGSLSGDALREEMAREAGVYLARLRANLPIVELIAALAPLLGLLGTVLGMIEAFQAMEAAGRQVDPSTLSGGIWKALLTTAVGLVVAVPAVILHNWLAGRIDAHAAEIDDQMVRLLTAAQRVPVTISAATTNDAVEPVANERASTRTPSAGPREDERTTFSTYPDELVHELARAHG